MLYSILLKDLEDQLSTLDRVHHLESPLIWDCLTIFHCLKYIWKRSTIFLSWGKWRKSELFFKLISTIINQFLGKFTSIDAKFIPVTDSICHRNPLRIENICILALFNIERGSLVSCFSNHIACWFENHKLVMMIESLKGWWALYLVILIHAELSET